MNRTQWLGLASKYRKLAYQFEQDAKRVQASAHPPSDRADRIRLIAMKITKEAQSIEAEFA